MLLDRADCEVKSVFRFKVESQPVRVVHRLTGPAVMVSPQPEHGVEHPAVEHSLGEVVDQQQSSEIKGFPVMTVLSMGSKKNKARLLTNYFELVTIVISTDWFISKFGADLFFMKLGPACLTMM